MAFRGRGRGFKVGPFDNSPGMIPPNNHQLNPPPAPHPPPHPPPPFPPDITMNSPVFTTETAHAGAIGKALSNMEPPWKKNPRVKISPAMRRKMQNKRLLRILRPRPATALLQEILPGFTYHVAQTNAPLEPNWFEVQIIHNGETVAKGGGVNTSEAKNVAAENAMQKHIAMCFHQLNKPVEEFTEDDETLAGLHLSGFAAFAVHRLYQEWQEKGFELPRIITPRSGPGEPKPKGRPPRPPKVPKQVPTDAASRHPTVLLNELRPGLPCTEISRTLAPFSTVTVEMMCDDQRFTATGPNKKEARKVCSQIILKNIFGVTYDNPPEEVAVATASRDD